jgi:uncharacterized membrane protein
MKKITLALLFAIGIFSVKAQIFFRNNYSKPVFVSVAYFAESKDFTGFVSKGWFRVIPGEKKEIVSYNPLSQYVYYYAKACDGTEDFPGNIKLLVNNKDGFTIKNANKSYVKDEKPYLKWKNFRTVDKGLKDAFKLKYTIEFDY